MKIFVTVGTTAFEELIKYMDQLQTKDEIILQISDKAIYKPIHKTFFEFTKDINKYYLESDIVITHAGAGSIYTLLELNKKIIIVPNMSRVDKHQLDIANYMSKNNFALVNRNINHLSQDIKDTRELKAYTYEPFFKGLSIQTIISDLY